MRLELYKAYKTRGGWKAVVVMDNTATSGTFLVWHGMGPKETKEHMGNGKRPFLGEDDGDIIEEWRERVRHEYDVTVMKSETGFIQYVCEGAIFPSTWKPIARIKVSFTEGDGL